jgi:ubiquinone biosynthesis protein
MTTLDLVRLFRAILSPRAALDTAAIERMGLLAVKIAQMYAVRPDLVAADKCLALSRLLRQTAPLASGELERRWDELAPAAFRAAIQRWEPAPLASASLGQVHLATLRDGRRVVVKLSRREARESFLADARRARRLLRVAVWAYPRLAQLADPMGTLATVERQTLTEMNFLAEPKGAARLAALAAFASDALPHLGRLRFPEYFPEFSHARFLVSEFIEGWTLAEWLERRRLPYETLLELFRIHGYFLFVRGEFHGDLHPGNVIWREGGFWFLDNANIERVPPAFAHGLYQMMLRLGQGELDLAAAALMDLSTTPLNPRQRRRLAEDFCALYRGSTSRAVREVSLTRQMMRTVKMAVAHGLRFPSGAFPVIKSLMYLDGMVLQCNPDAVLLRDVARFAGDFQAAPDAAPGSYRSASPAPPAGGAAIARAIPNPIA